MAFGLVGRKCGMTRRFTDDGISVPVTVVEVLPQRITQVKNVEKDGYMALQLTTGEKNPNKLNKAQKGHFAKAETGPGDGVWEFRIEPNEEVLGKKLQDFKLGDEINLEYFEVGQSVDTIGTSKGKGFAGAVKRHNFKTQDMTHGNSLAHRAPGSIGQNQTPGRVFKGKKMAGQMGNVRKTIQNLEIYEIDKVRNLLLIRGAIPGSKKSHIIIKKSVKAR